MDSNRWATNSAPRSPLHPLVWLLVLAAALVAAPFSPSQDSGPVAAGDGVSGDAAANGVPTERAEPARPSDDAREAKTFRLGAPPGSEGSSPPDFQAYVFWAYGLTCVLIFGFTTWTILQARQLDRRVHYLRERFERAHPEER